MAAPIVSWFERDNSAQVTSWAIGTVDAGSVSADKGVLVWNNKGGTVAVSDMTNCTVTSKDSAGGNTGELVTNTWIEAKIDSLGEGTFTPVGGTVTKAIRATAITPAGFPAGVIKGGVNDGTKPNAKDNYCEMTLHANVPATATAGNVNFLTRVAYQYT